MCDLSDLRKHGLIHEDGDELVITDAGLDVLGADAPRIPATTDEVLALWRSTLKAGARRIRRGAVPHLTEHDR